MMSTMMVYLADPSIMLPLCDILYKRLCAVFLAIYPNYQNTYYPYKAIMNLVNNDFLNIEATHIELGYISSIEPLYMSVYISARVRPAKNNQDQILRQIQPWKRWSWTRKSFFLIWVLYFSK